MGNVSVVIGANFGDEGKGLITDYLCSQKESLVVRFNGGAQAGHTVVTPNGSKHVFHSFGSGSLLGAPTFLSQYFVFNPMFYEKEYIALKGLGVDPEVYADPRCLVTTPYDIMLNQAVESERGARFRHGSCGMGFNETIQRSEDPQFLVTVDDLDCSSFLKEKLDHIRRNYVPIRKESLGITGSITRKLPYLIDDRVLNRFVNEARTLFFNNRSILKRCKWENLEQNKNLVFEGAQGLLLDMDHPNFPHVTRSKTGLHNVVKLLKARGLEKETVGAYYLTRTYLTRHGAGPLSYEMFREKPYKEVVDETNIPNAYQGSLRFAYQDIDTLTDTILRDLEGSEGLHIMPHIAVTCADQVDDGKVKYFQTTGNGFNIRTGLHQGSVGQFTNTIMDAVESRNCLISYGPTRKTIQKLGD